MATKRVKNAAGEVLDPRTHPEYYAPDKVRNASVWSTADVRREYARLRHNVNRGLARVAGTMYAQEDAYKEYADKFVPLAEISSEQELRELFAQVSRAWRINISVGKYKRDVAAKIDTLHAHGYDFVNKNNFYAFRQFMEDMRAKHGAYSIPSDIYADMFGVAERNKIDPYELEQAFNDAKMTRRDLEIMASLEVDGGSADELVELTIKEKKARMKKPGRKKRKQNA